MPVRHTDPVPALATAPVPAPDFESLARLIHDDVLQTLAVGVLKAELCHRSWGRAKDGQILAELAGVISALEDTAAACHSTIDELRLLEAWCQQGRTVPPVPAARARANLAPWARAGRGSADDRPECAVSAGQIVHTLSICLLQAELCRHLYQQGEEARALRELSVLLERLENVVEMFRAVMETLRRALAWTRARSV